VSSAPPDDAGVIAIVALDDDAIARLDAMASRRGMRRVQLLGVLICSGLDAEERRLVDVLPSGVDGLGPKVDRRCTGN